MMTSKEIVSILERYRDLRFDEYKVSYFILKPNAAKHYRAILNELENSQFVIISQYAITDYETVNMALHLEQPNALKYIIPISHMYKDFYGNFGILLVVAKRNITYENFCLQIVGMKHTLREKFELSYISYAFDTSELGQTNEHQKLLVIAKDGAEVKKDRFNSEGTYMVFSINEIHSPDESVETTIAEMKLINSMGIICEDNIIPKPMIVSMKRYHTFEFIKDMF